jgi:hypothetical protein
MHEHDTPCDCKEHASAMEQPLAPGNYPAAPQGEATIVIMPLGAAANAN